MERQAAGGRAPGAAGPSAPSPGAGCDPAGPSDQEQETQTAGDGLGNGAQSILNDSPSPREGVYPEEEGEEGFTVDGDDSDCEPSAWELPEEVSEEVSGGSPKGQAADLFTEDWDLELKADQGNPYDADDIQGCISQEIKPWVCCAPQGDMIYDPSWHHPPPLIPHYSKMVFETGQFDDAED
ncbi:coordinator of PRMT5 and differentiation stimulator isoform X1 [Sorex fumeus]|uniref:coordinator of PRMT5 and differentiation stimulator isoform X1 n=1 Tax=Sorex fumeus TaxID=62283 RepID=UPI0024AD1043|nr:coordinator of PRMT5 and differentiation stimulator isoform X1 [Sorex fumeus]